MLPPMLQKKHPKKKKFSMPVLAHQSELPVDSTSSTLDIPNGRRIQSGMRIGEDLMDLWPKNQNLAAFVSFLDFDYLVHNLIKRES